MRLGKLFMVATALTIATAPLAAASKNGNGDSSVSNVGVVNFREAIEQSKFGKQEQTSFEAMQNQMMGQMEATQKELQEIVGKLQDREYLDGISPEAEQQLQMKGQQLSQTLEAQRQQFQAILQQAQVKMIQLLSNQVKRASELVAQKQGLDLVLQEEAAFYFQPSFDVTDNVVAEMNTIFDKEESDDAAANGKGG